jgi:hypothetical protein
MWKRLAIEIGTPREGGRKDNRTAERLQGKYTVGAHPMPDWRV